MRGDVFMPAYEKMYHKLFNRVTDTIEQLKAAQMETEDIYMYDSKTESTAKKTDEG